MFIAWAVKPTDIDVIILCVDRTSVLSKRTRGPIGVVISSHFFGDFKS